MTKPELLNGEVKEFIDLEIIDLDYKGSLPTVHKFYQQKFIPEMVTEYFEGWEGSGKGELYLDKDHIFNDYKNGYKIGLGNSGLLYIQNDAIKLSKIKTLSQFITCCIMAGIKLVWR